MCGIAGIYKFYGQEVHRQELNLMIEVQHHRGPDGNGVWISDEKNVGLGHNRLSIIDLSDAAAQPMNYLNYYTITYNGEIYNYKQLKKDLISKGYQFKSESDTEVVLAMYAEYGVDCLQYFDGMFAFVIWDNKHKRMFCARDRFGEKPFHYYYSASQGVFIFASEIKAILASNLVKRKIDHYMMYHFLANNLVENPFDLSETFYENIYRLDAAHCLVIEPNGRLSKTKYWNVENIKHENVLSETDVEDKFREILTNSILSRLNSDVPVGTSLSGGLDSSTIACVINNFKNHGQVQKTFSARFYDKSLDEGKYIDIVKNHCSFSNHQVWLDENTLLNQIEETLYFQEEPYTGASAIAQWEVMKLASQHGVKVLIDGQGADEYLAGYAHFTRTYLKELYSKNYSLYKSEMSEYKKLYGFEYDKGSNFFAEIYFGKKINQLRLIKDKFLGTKKNILLNKDYSHQFGNNKNPFEIFSNLNDSVKYNTTRYGLHKLLRMADRNSMAHSVEVRLPFLNHRLVEFVFSLPPHFLIRNGWSKFILRQSMKEILPHEICWRKDKLGFQPPQKEWLQSKAIQPVMNDAKTWLYSNHYINKDGVKQNEWNHLMAYLFLRQ